MRDYTYEIALTMIPGLGRTSTRHLVQVIDSAEALFSMTRSDLRQLFGQRTAIIDAIVNKTMMAEAEKEMKFVEKHQIQVLYYNEPAFPQRLNRSDCDDCPVVLYFIGNADLNATKAISVVGTRHSTPEGREATAKIVSGFSGMNMLVVSGLALGIDSCAHTAALNCELPTVGVLGHGLDLIYPSQNRNLAKNMLECGGLITEMPSGTHLHPKLFPARNRIIAAMSDATLVVEAASSGGALITANIASGYHRDLFAVPGRISDKYSEGCNAIIASHKAILVRNANDIMNNMGWEPANSNKGRQTELFPTLKGDEQTIYQLIGQHSDGCTVDDMRSLCDLPLPKIATALLGLELKGLCVCLPGKIYKTL